MATSPLLLLPAVLPAVAAATPVLAETRSGLIEGYATVSAYVFRGVPFGQAGRWESPTWPSEWNGTRKTVEDGPGCPQTCSTWSCPTSISEDCLYLNIFTPKNRSSKDPYPVMVFFHGGGFSAGYCGGPIYDGEALASKGIIVISANYRLGALGFLDRSHKISGNYGIQDQTFALEWVQANIEGFNGDIERVTIAGQSAGAQSVANHMHQFSRASEKNLFMNAILMSDPFSISFLSRTEAHHLANVFVETSPCKGFLNVEKCLRNLAVDELLRAQTAVEQHKGGKLLEYLETWVPTHGTEEVPEDPFEAWRKGRLKHGSAVLLGTVRDEGIPITYAKFSAPLPSSQYVDVVAKIFGGANAKGVLALYPPTNTGDARGVLANLTTATLFECPTRYLSLWADTLMRDLVVYPYTFGQTMNPELARVYWGDSPEGILCAAGRVCHAGDLPFVFYPKIACYTDNEKALIEAIQTYYTNFVKTGDPNFPTSGNELWIPVGAGMGDSFNLMNLTGPVPHLLYDPHNATCGFFDGLGYNRTDLSI